MCSSYGIKDTACKDSEIEGDTSTKSLVCIVSTVDL